MSAYGLGGIGMTTAFANGALQLQILEALAEVNGHVDLMKGFSKGKIGNDVALEKLNIFYGENIFEDVNYKAMIDDPQKVARSLGFDQSNSGSEKQQATITGCVVATTIGWCLHQKQLFGI